MNQCRELPDQSFVCGKLPISCVMCQQGAKMVLLVTGKCAHKCYYCPLSMEKKGRDNTYANEKLVEVDEDIIFEAESINARGTGITGGDPLLAMAKTIHCIRLLKEKFGQGHNIHLYTATPDPEKVQELAEAGLDEIRFHPPPEYWARLEQTGYPEAISSSKKIGLRAGLEIPCIPGKDKEIIALAKAAKKAGSQFINLNELEFSESNWQALKSMGFRVKDDVSSAVAGSQDTAQAVAEALEGIIIVHYCSSGFKDNTQLRNRIMRRARNMKTPLEIINEDGMFLKGIIETGDISGTLEVLENEYNVPPELMRHDAVKDRIEIAAWVLEELPEISECKYFIVEEYPTADRLEVEKRPIN